jgi:hypothetical protein
MVNSNDTRRRKSPHAANDAGKSVSPVLQIPERKLDDEFIAALANMPENRRARQVSEWEKIRYGTTRLAA